MKKLISLFLILAFSFTNLNATQYFVKAGVTGGTADGSSWVNAFSDLQPALDLAVLGDVIWVAKGTYYPSEEFSVIGTSGTQAQTFHITDSLQVFGGFEGNENPLTFNLDDRDMSLNETILSGNINNPADSTDNCYHVITTEYVTAYTTVDGFTIRDASTPSSGFDATGGGWLNYGESYYSNPTIKNCLFTKNVAYTGAGFASLGSYSGEASPALENCIFRENKATYRGGAAYFTGYSGKANPTITNCLFEENRATSFAGAIYFEGSGSSSGLSPGEVKPIISKSKFIGNVSGNISEHAIYFKSEYGVAEPVITQSEFRDNSGGIAFYATNGSAKGEITNCVFYKSESYHLGFDGALANTSPTFTNCTFVASQYGALNMRTYDAATSPIVFVNCIFKDNTSDIVGGSAGSGASGNAKVSVSYSIVSEFSFGGVDNNIYAYDPLLYNKDKGILVPSKCSPAIDAGDPAILLSEDVSGNPRPYGAGRDIGAYEYQGAVFVKANATGGNDGSSWKNALTDLQDALVSPCLADVEVWVAKGTYYPTADGDSTIYFEIPDSLKIYGGFAGNEALDYDKSLRDFETNESILSGDIGVTGDSTDNTFHVIRTTSVSDKTVVDGFTITAGNSRGYGTFSYGGGWQNRIVSEISRTSNPIIRNCVFYQNSARSGGAFSNTIFSSSNFTMNPLFEHCLFKENLASSNGGAILNHSLNTSSPANPTFNFCDFVGNIGSDRAGAVYTVANNGWAAPNFNSCRFIENVATQAGAIVLQGTDGKMESVFNNCIFQNNGNSHVRYIDPLAGFEPSFTNCTFYGALSHSFDLETWSSGMQPFTVKNSIFWNNNGDVLSGSQGSDNSRINISFSNVDEASFAPANNNLSTDPLFKDPLNFDLSLKPCSPLINQGNNTGISGVDLAGANRIFNAGVVDMGAYEYGGFYNSDAVYNISTDVLATAEYIGNEYIMADNTVTSPNEAVYQAGKAVELSPGFETESNVVFKAIIKESGCL